MKRKLPKVPLPSSSPLVDFLDRCSGNPELAFLAKHALIEEVQEDGTVVVKIRPFKPLNVCKCGERSESSAQRNEEEGALR